MSTSEERLDRTTPAVATLALQRGAHPVPRYVVIGDGYRLYPELDYLRGLRGMVEAVWLRWVTPQIAGSAVGDSDVVAAVADVAGLLGPLRRGLLLHTATYKETTVVGPVVTESGQRAFVKVFADCHAVGREAERAKQVGCLAEGSFRIARLVSTSDRTVAYELLSHGRVRPRAREALLDRVVDMARRSMERTQRGDAPDADAVELVQLAAAYGLRGPVVEKGAAVLAEHGRCPAHGDLTPWNVFVTGEGEPALVDYEEVGFAPPLTDAFHLVTQPRVLADNVGLPVRALRRVAQRAGLVEATVAELYVAYLAHALRRDVTRAIVERRTHRQLPKLINARHALLGAAVAAYDSEA